jgi:hypothetical protein
MDQIYGPDAGKTGLIGMIYANPGDGGGNQRKWARLIFITVGGTRPIYSIRRRLKHHALSHEHGDLGMEAIYEFDVQDMPVIVAVDSLWQRRAQNRPTANGAKELPGSVRQEISSVVVALGSAIPPCTPSCSHFPLQPARSPISCPHPRCFTRHIVLVDGSSGYRLSDLRLTS